MAPDTGALQSRVAQLEEELATVVAQVLGEGTACDLIGCRAVLPAGCMSSLLQHNKSCSHPCCAGRGGSHRRRAGLAGGRVCCLGALSTLRAAVHVHRHACAVLPAARKAGAHPPPTPATLPPPLPATAADQRAALPPVGGQAHCPGGREGQIVSGK